MKTKFLAAVVRDGSCGTDTQAAATLDDAAFRAVIAVLREQSSPNNSACKLCKSRALPQASTARTRPKLAIFSVVTFGTGLS